MPGLPGIPEFSESFVAEDADDEGPGHGPDPLAEDAQDVLRGVHREHVSVPPARRRINGVYETGYF